LEKRGLTAKLQEAGLKEPEVIFWADEMRVGLIGSVRRVWASVGVKVVQSVEYKYQSCYLNLAVNALTGKLLWAWTPNMKGESLATVVKDWSVQGVAAVVWDGARGHSGTAYADCSVARIVQPPYSPELNPAERLFEYLRSRVEGIVYNMIENKQQAVERELEKLIAQPELVKSIAGWQWIQDSISALEQTIYAS
jgi:transposase